MNIFLTGATGFVGRNLAVKLEQRGHKVHCLIRDPAKAGWMSRHPGLIPVPGDLADRGSYEAIVRNAEVVFHAAGVTKARSRGEFLRVNGEGTGNMARAAASPGSRVKKFVYVSSLAVAGPHGARLPAREEEEPAPITPYGESKLLGERLLRENLRAVPWTVVRPPVAYGPYDRDVYLLFRAGIRGIIPLIGGGKLELSIIHVDDLTDVLVLAGFAGAADGKTFYVSDGSAYTTAEIARVLRGVTGKGAVLPIPSPLLRVAGLFGDLGAALTGKAALLSGHKVVEILQEGWVCAIDRIRKELGYRPKIDIGSGFRSTMDWYRTAGWI